jgi:hypothetical protein
MFGMTRQRSTCTVSLIFVTAAALPFPWNAASHHAPAQQPRGDMLLVTSFGAADMPAPDILPEIFRTNIEGSIARQELS